MSIAVARSCGSPCAQCLQIAWLPTSGGRRALAAVFDLVRLSTGLEENIMTATDRTDLDELSINTMRTLAIDAIQQ
jgi:hypothetical protein